MTHARERSLRVGILWRAALDADPALVHPLFEPLARELAAHGVEAVPVRFAEEGIARVRHALLELDAVLVWVDPISQGRSRARLDDLLREAAEQGVHVSAHPDVILKMGSKEVLYSTRTLGWGTDTRLYTSVAALRDGFPRVLAASGPRVLKQNRGNGGLGVFRVDLVEQDVGGKSDARVAVQHAERGSAREELPLDELLRRCERYFDDGGRIVDQPFLPRHAEGMIRCYVVQSLVAGFGHQHVTALMEPAPGHAGPPPPPPRIYCGPDEPRFQALRARLENEWIPGLQALLEIDPESLPMLWDADFLLGPKDEIGNDTYVLCEINSSSVFPFPDEALEPLARAVTKRVGERGERLRTGRVFAPIETR